MKYRLLAIVLVYCICDDGLCAPTLSYGDGVGSPDGLFTAVYLESAIRIEDNPGAKNSTHVSVFPVYTLNWTGDSKSLVITEHLAGGCEAALIYLDQEGHWKRLDIEPLVTEYDEASVVALIIRDHSLSVTYKRRQHDGGAKFHAYVCSFDIDARTLARSNEKITSISATEYKSLKQVNRASVKSAFKRE